MCKWNGFAGTQMWDMWERNAGGSSMLHEPPPAHNLKHSLAQEARNSSIPSAWSCESSDWTATLSVNGEAVRDVSSDELSLRGSTKKKKKGSRIDTSAAVTQSGCRTVRGHNKVDSCLWVQKTASELRRPSIIKKSRHAKPLMTCE